MIVPNDKPGAKPNHPGEMKAVAQPHRIEMERQYPDKPFIFLLRNGKWHQAELLDGGRLRVTERFDSLDKAARYLRACRRIGYSMNDIMRYW